jgi:hypothetical protein
MDYFVDLGLPNKTLSILNRCRVYLQVITLSDIATANGLSILPCIKGDIRETTRTSKLLSPYQDCPPSPEWNLWSSHLGERERYGR